MDIAFMAQFVTTYHLGSCRIGCAIPVFFAVKRKNCRKTFQTGNISLVQNGRISDYPSCLYRFLATVDIYPFAVCIFLLVLMGGLFEVPCLALIQRANIGRKTGDMLAYMNFMIFIFILIGTVIFSLVTYISHKNSIAVFITILVLCLITLMVMYPKCR